MWPFTNRKFDRIERHIETINHELAEVVKIQTKQAGVQIEQGRDIKWLAKLLWAVVAITVISLFGFLLKTAWDFLVAP